jgi:Fe-S cluster biogenesis protein NfuA
MGTITDEEIKIKAEVLDAGRCRLSVDRPVLRMGGSLQFQSRTEAKRHALAEMVFGVEGVSGLLLSGSNVVVERKAMEGEPEDWIPIARQVGRAIRAYLKSQSAEMAAPLPHVEGGVEDQIRVKVQHILDTQINPGVAGHGGQVQLLEVRGVDIYLKMGGGCQGCGQAAVTLKQGVERAIRQSVPEVAQIFDTTDHAGGQNPYYSPGNGAA